MIIGERGDSELNWSIYLDQEGGSGAHFFHPLELDRKRVKASRFLQGRRKGTEFSMRSDSKFSFPAHNLEGRMKKWLD